MRKNSVKMIRINREFQRELSSLISMEIKDPRVSPVTSVVSVEVAPDLKTSKVYISVLGDAESQKNTLEGLKSAASFLRSQLAHNLNLRNTPELHFYVDQSIEYGVNMSHKISEVIAEDEAAMAQNAQREADENGWERFDEGDDEWDEDVDGENDWDEDADADDEWGEDPDSHVIADGQFDDSDQDEEST